jgi:CheY-like chemotaxis protein
MKIVIENLKFLIVDDYVDMRSVLRNMLVSFGVTDIDVESNGKDAISAIEKTRYDVILCDYNLGEGRDGQQVLEEIRHRKLIGVGTVFIMVTAENTRVMVMGAVEYEPDSYLTKPFTKDLLGQRLIRMLKKKADLIEIERAIDRHDYDEANRLIDEKLAKKGLNHNALTRIKAELAISDQQFDQAERIYRNVLDKREMAWAKLGLGKAMFGKEQYHEAKTIFSELVKENERFMAAYDWLAKTMEMLNEFKEAQQVLQKGVTMSAKAIPRQKALAELALKNGDEKSAEFAFNQAITLGKHSIYKHPSMFANIAQLKAKKGHQDEAERYVRDIGKNFKGSPEAELYTAISNTMILKDDDSIKKNMEIANKLYNKIGINTSHELAVDMAKACSKTGDDTKAKQILHFAASNNHTDTEILKEISDALGDLKLEANPASFISGIQKGIIKLNNDGAKLAREGKLEEAMNLFEDVAEDMEGNMVVNLNAARTFLMYMEQSGTTTELTKKLQKYLQRAQHIDPSNRALLKLQNRSDKLLGVETIPEV